MERIPIPHGPIRLVDITAYSYGLIVCYNMGDETVTFLDQLILKGERIPLRVERTYIVGSSSRQIHFVLIQSKGMERIKRMDYLKNSGLPAASTTFLELDKREEQKPVLTMDFDGLPAGSPVSVTLTMDVFGTVKLQAKSIRNGQWKEAESVFDLMEALYPSLGCGIHSFSESGSSFSCVNIQKAGESFSTEKTFTFYTASQNMAYMKLPFYLGGSKEDAYPISEDQRPALMACVPLPNALPAGAPVRLTIGIADEQDLRIRAEADGHDPVTVVYHHVVKAETPELIKISPDFPLQHRKAPGELQAVKPVMFKSSSPSSPGIWDAIGEKTVYGIDLGAATSCIARVNPGTNLPEVIRDNEMDMDTMASAVFFSPDGEEYFGDDAVEAGYVLPERLCAYFQRYMGNTGLHLAEQEKEQANRPRYLLEGINGVTHSPEELTSMLLQQMAAYVRKGLGDEVKQAVFTCPAHFDHGQQEAIRKAAEMAGVHVVSIIPDPVAVAAGYWFNEPDQEEKETYLVFDLGGTFQLALGQFHREKGTPIIDLWDVDGRDDFGGRNWDERLYNITRRKMEDAVEMSILPGSDEDLDLKSRIETAKKALSRPSGTAKVILSDGEKVIITRDEFEKATEDLVSFSLTLVDRLLNENSRTVEQIDKVFLVGGCARMQMIQQALFEKFGQEKIILHEPETAVARGAAAFFSGNFQYHAIKPSDQQIVY